MLSKRSDDYPLRRREVVAQLLEDRGELLVVAGLGAPAWDATAAGDHPLTFPLWGAMGGAVIMGLGLALAQQIAAAHEGLLSYEPQHQGSRFTLRLPLERSNDCFRADLGRR